MTESGFFSRLEAAGHNPDVLRRSRVLVLGGGAGGSNVILALLLMGLGNVFVCDFDAVEPHNLPHSPPFRAEDVGRPKAEALAERFAELSHVTDCQAHFATVPFQALGWGVFREVDCVVCALDSFALRADVADLTRRMGVPLIELGFLAPQGQVSVWQNADPDAACWRCLHPRVSVERFGCKDVARLLAARGFGASTQSIAGAVGSIAAEAVVRALHGDFPLAEHVFFLDIRSGRASLARAERRARCRGAHAHAKEAIPVSVGPDAPLARLLKELGDDAIVQLPWPFVRRTPCRVCRTLVEVNRPTWGLTELPVCDGVCGLAPGNGGAEILSTVSSGDAVVDRSCRDVGLGPGAIFEACVEGKVAAYRLDGSPLELFESRSKRTETSNQPSKG